MVESSIRSTARVGVRCAVSGGFLWCTRLRLRGSRLPMADRWPTGMSFGKSLSGPMQAIGGLFAMAADAAMFTFRRPFQWREFLEQAWFVARVSMLPTLLVAIP